MNTISRFASVDRELLAEVHLVPLGVYPATLVEGATFKMTRHLRTRTPRHIAELLDILEFSYATVILTPQLPQVLQLVRRGTVYYLVNFMTGQVFNVLANPNTGELCREEFPRA